MGSRNHASLAVWVGGSLHSRTLERERMKKGKDLAQFRSVYRCHYVIAANDHRGFLSLPSFYCPLNGLTHTKMLPSKSLLLFMVTSFKKKNGHPASDRAACLKDKVDHGSFFDPVFHD